MGIIVYFKQIFFLGFQQEYGDDEDSDGTTNQSAIGEKVIPTEVVSTINFFLRAFPLMEGGR